MKVLGSTDRDKYAEILSSARKNAQKVSIANRFPWQTKMATLELLGLANEAKEDVSILTGSGCESFFDGEIIAALEQAASAGCKIRVLVWKKDKSTISKDLISMAQEKRIELAISGTDTYADRIPHFLLVGTKAYRQEAGHRELTNADVISETEPEFPARISFNDPATALQIKGFFDSIWAA